jgi:hypothetical protein
MAILMSMLGQTVGFPVPEGGAGRLTEALASRLRARGGEIQCDAEVSGIVVRDGRACAVGLRGGERFEARRAVVAAVTAPVLYGRLLAPADVPASTRKGMERFQQDPATVKVDWALDGVVPWAGTPPYQPGTVHVADSVADATEALAQVAAGFVPARPFMLAGQMTTSDPTRSPPGTESMWAYTHVPQHAADDAGEGGIRGTWDSDDKERFADRMQQRIELLAPGFGSRVLSRRILGPHDLEARNASLVGGAINGGTSQLHQELVFRPVPGAGRAETKVAGLYLGSSSAHPGGGVHGAAGMNAARAALAHARVERPASRIARADGQVVEGLTQLLGGGEHPVCARLPQLCLADAAGQQPDRVVASVAGGADVPDGVAHHHGRPLADAGENRLDHVGRRLRGLHVGTRRHRVRLLRTTDEVEQAVRSVRPAPSWRPARSPRGDAGPARGARRPGAPGSRRWSCRTARRAGRGCRLRDHARRPRRPPR